MNSICSFGFSSCPGSTRWSALWSDAEQLTCHTEIRFVSVCVCVCVCVCGWMREENIERKKRRQREGERLIRTFLLAVFSGFIQPESLKHGLKVVAAAPELHPAGGALHAVGEIT